MTLSICTGGQEGRLERAELPGGQSREIGRTSYRVLSRVLHRGSERCPEERGGGRGEVDGGGGGWTKENIVVVVYEH